MPNQYVTDAPWMGLPPVAGDQSLYFARAMQALGNPTSFGVNWYDYDAAPNSSGTAPPSWLQSTVTANWTASVSPRTDGGWTRIAVTNASSGVVIQQYSNTPLVAAPGTQRCYVAHRFQLGNAVSTNEVAYFGLHNIAGTKSLGVAYAGNLHTTNYVVLYDGTYGGGAASFVNTGIACDANPHIVEYWTDGANGLYVRFDGVLLPKATMASPAVDGYYMINDVRNNGVATAQSWSRDWHLIVYPRT